MAKAKKKAEAAPKPVQDEASGYMTTDYHGFKNYHCAHCKYASTDLELFEAHVAGRHPDTTAAD